MKRDVAENSWTNPRRRKTPISRSSHNNIIIRDRVRKSQKQYLLEIGGNP